MQYAARRKGSRFSTVRDDDEEDCEFSKAVISSSFFASSEFVALGIDAGGDVYFCLRIKTPVCALCNQHNVAKCGFHVYEELIPVRPQ